MIHEENTRFDLDLFLGKAYAEEMNFQVEDEDGNVFFI